MATRQVIVYRKLREKIKQLKVRYQKKINIEKGKIIMIINYENLSPAVSSRGHLILGHVWSSKNTKLKIQMG